MTHCREMQVVPTSNFSGGMVSTPALYSGSFGF